MSLHVIVSQNALNSKSPRGLNHLKTRTTGRATVFDYRTFLSLRSAGFLGRGNCVLVKDASCLRNQHPDIRFFTNPKDVLNLAQNEDIFVVGEKSIHEDFLRVADIVHVMLVGKKIPRKDRPFSEIEADEWNLCSELSFSPDPENENPFKCQTYVRKT